MMIGALAKRYGLSRSTLLYYGKIGLLQPTSRNHAGYRIYSEHDQRRLTQIIMYRELGLSLQKIAAVLENQQQEDAVLEARLQDLNQQVKVIRKKQYAILKLLQRRALGVQEGMMDKASWIDLLRATGLSERDMERWHCAFESSAPEAHQAFLESLGMEADEIVSVRQLASNTVTQ